MIMVDLFLLVTTLKSCEVLFPLISNTAQKESKDVNFQSKIKQSFFMFSKSAKKQTCLLLIFFFIGSYVTTKVIVLRPNFCTLLIWLFKILHAFAHQTTITWHWDHQTVWITLSPVFLFTYYLKSLPRGCEVIFRDICILGCLEPFLLSAFLSNMSKYCGKA